MTTVKEKATSYTLTYPEVGTDLLTTDRNTSEKYFEEEREKIFKRVWLNVGRVDELPNIGDFVVKDIPTVQASIIIVRGKDGNIRGFHNICRHRGNKLTRECAGKVNGFSCGFHGWTYDTEGKLAYVPDEQGFFDFDKEDFGLLPVAIETWEGFIFINMDSQPKEGLKQFLGQLATDLEGYPFSDMQLDAEYAITVDCNWKVFSDAFQEAYHVAFIHKNTFPDQFTGEDNPFCNMSAFRVHGYHNVATVRGNPEHEPTPLEAFAREIGTSSYGAALGDGDGNLELPRGINPEKTPSYMFDLHSVFPNFQMHIGVGFYYTYNFFPISVNKTRWIMRLYGFPATNAGQLISKEYTKIMLRDAVKEDINTTENTQKNMDSGLLPYMVLHDQEFLLRHKYKVVDDFVRPSRIEEAS